MAAPPAPVPLVQPPPLAWVALHDVPPLAGRNVLVSGPQGNWAGSIPVNPVASSKLPRLSFSIVTRHVPAVTMYRLSFLRGTTHAGLGQLYILRRTPQHMAVPAPHAPRFIPTVGHHQLGAPLFFNPLRVTRRLRYVLLGPVPLQPGPWAVVQPRLNAVGWLFYDIESQYEYEITLNVQPVQVQGVVQGMPLRFRHDNSRRSHIPNNTWLFDNMNLRVQIQNAVHAST